MKFIKSFVLAFTVLTAQTDIALSKTINTIQLTSSLKTVNPKVKGITCLLNLKMISANIENVNDLSGCEAERQKTTFEVKYNPALVTEKEIFADIENTGSCENTYERPYQIKQ